MYLSNQPETKVSVRLTAKADGTKLKPFIVFQGAKQEAAALKEEIKNRGVVTSFFTVG